MMLCVCVVEYMDVKVKLYYDMYDVTCLSE